MTSQVWEEATASTSGGAACRQRISTAFVIQESGGSESTGFMSMTGVPSMASNGPTLSCRPVTSKTVTRCNPRGLGRSGDRVTNTPVSGNVLSPRGCSFNTLRSARWNHVIKIISWPAAIPCSPSATFAVTSSHASGAPSTPCLGAFWRILSGDRINPIGIRK